MGILRKSVVDMVTRSYSYLMVHFEVTGCHFVSVSKSWRDMDFGIIESMPWVD